MNGIFHAIQSLAYLTAAVFSRVRLGTPSSNHLPIRVLNNNIEHLPVGTLILIFLSFPEEGPGSPKSGSTSGAGGAAAVNSRFGNDSDSEVSLLDSEEEDTSLPAVQWVKKGAKAALPSAAAAPIAGSRVVASPLNASPPSLTSDSRTKISKSHSDSDSDATSPLPLAARLGIESAKAKRTVQRKKAVPSSAAVNVIAAVTLSDDDDDDDDDVMVIEDHDGEDASLPGAASHPVGSSRNAVTNTASFTSSSPPPSSPSPSPPSRTTTVAAKKVHAAGKGKAAPKTKAAKGNKRARDEVDRDRAAAREEREAAKRAKKEAKEQEKAQRAAERAANKQRTPDERLEEMTVKVESTWHDVLEKCGKTAASKGKPDMFAALQAKANVVHDTDVINEPRIQSIRWSRRRSAQAAAALQALAGVGTGGSAADGGAGPGAGAAAAGDGPAEDEEIDEKQVMVRITAATFMKLLDERELINFVEEHIVERFPTCTPTLIIEGLQKYFKAIKIKETKAWKAAVERKETSSTKFEPAKQKRAMVEMALIAIQMEFDDMKVRVSYDVNETASLVYYYSKSVASAIDKTSFFGLGFCPETSRKPQKVQTKNGFAGLKNVWIEQLQQIRGVSEAVAQAIAEAYPSPKALVAGFRERGHHAIRDVRVRRGSSTSNCGPKISELLHTFFTATNGEQLVE